MQKKMNQPVVKYLKTKPVTVLLFLGMTFSILMPPRITAVGFRLPNQDPEAIARGNAFAATADDPSAIYYNPAGITQLKGQNLRVGIYAVSAGIKYNSAAGSATAKSDLQPVPQVYYVDSFANAPVSRSATGHHGCGGPRPHQSFFQVSQIPVLLENYGFKIVPGGLTDTPFPRKRLETKYFIFLRFGCQTGAEVAVRLSSVDVHRGGHHKACHGGTIGERKELGAASDADGRAAEQGRAH